MESVPQLRRPLEVTPEGKDYSLIASLPKNSTALATQAEEAGVDAILLNIDGDEGSSPSHYGSYDLHDVYIDDVISTVSVPCGISVGGGKQLTAEYWERIMASSFSFVEMYAHQMPLWILSDSRVKKIGAIASGYTLEQVRNLSSIPEVEAIEAATVPPQSKGLQFTLLDYATIGTITALSGKPVLLRTQKRLNRGDVARVLAKGVKGLVVDSCSLSGAEEAYKDELSDLAPRRQPAGI